MDFNINDRTHTKLYKELENVAMTSVHKEKLSSILNIEHLVNNEEKYSTFVQRNQKRHKTKSNAMNITQTNENHFKMFRAAMFYLLLWGQMIGLCPVLGISENNYSELRFTIFSWRFLYSTSVATLQLLILLANVAALIKGFTILSIGTLQFNVCCTLAAFNFVIIARRWPKISKEVATSCISVGADIKWKCRITFFTIMIMGVVEHILFTILSFTSMVECEPDVPIQEYFVRSNYPFLFNIGVTVSIPLYVVLQFLNVISYMCWTFQDLFVICISIYLTSILDEVRRKIQFSKDKDLPTAHWRSLREQYTKATEIVRHFDDLINTVIFLSFASTLLFICLKIFNVLKYGFRANLNEKCPNYPSGPFGGYEHAVYFTYSSMYVLFRSISITLFASNVHTASLTIAPELYEAPSSVGSEINRFIEQAHGDTVALTGFRFFYMSRKIVLSVAGTIITYELVLMQFNGEL